jgi:hypothetical protein
MRHGWQWVVLVAVVGAANTGCGIIGWGISGKSEVTSYTLTRTMEVEVDSNPEGATIYVDGAEAGVTPKSVLAQVTQVRSTRRQSVVPGLVGLGLDILGFGVASAVCIEGNSGECLLLSAGIGVAVILTGTYLVFGRSTTDESLDVMPTVIDIRLSHPGYQDWTRHIRVPDLTEVHFNLVPLGGRGPAAPAAPQVPAAPDAPTRQR